LYAQWPANGVTKSKSCNSHRKGGSCGGRSPSYTTYYPTQVRVKKYPSRRKIYRSKNRQRYNYKPTQPYRYQTNYQPTTSYYRTNSYQEPGPSRNSLKNGCDGSRCWDSHKNVNPDGSWSTQTSWKPDNNNSNGYGYTGYDSGYSPCSKSVSYDSYGNPTNSGGCSSGHGPTQVYVNDDNYGYNNNNYNNGGGGGGSMGGYACSKKKHAW